jgi:hypothetical protein
VRPEDRKTYLDAFEPRRLFYGTRCEGAPHSGASFFLRVKKRAFALFSR